MGAGAFVVVVRKLWDGVARVDCGGVRCALVLVLLLLGADIMLLESLMPLRHTLSCKPLNCFQFSTKLKYTLAFDTPLS